MKQVISEQAAYTMVRMMQGPVDFGTAAGLRARLGAAEMSGKTGTTNDNSDAWFLGYTPQLLGGTWIGCDDRFIRLESGLGYGGKAAMPIWEYFFRKVYADKTLGIEKEAKFQQPENMNIQAMKDYDDSIDKTLDPGAEGVDQGNGSASDYKNFERDTNHVPIESKLSPDEQKILNDASKQPKKDDAKPDQNPPEEKKKKGFFNRLFGKKDKKE
ncbi:MAG: penicillin-binding transpeptidase domain-containing protein, partial [Bacteroidota bacterium]